MTVQPHLPEPEIDGDELLRLAMAAADTAAALLGEIEQHPGCLNDPALCGKVRSHVGAAASHAVLTLEELTIFLTGRQKFLQGELNALRERQYVGKGAWHR